MAVYAGPEVVTNGLVLALDAGNTQSYPGSGTTWTDLSGKGNNGTLTNGPTFNSNNRGSIVFDGVNDKVVSSAGSDFAYGTGDFSIEGWFNSTAALPNYGATLFSQTISGTNYIWVWLGDGTATPTQNKVGFTFAVSGSGTSVVSSTTWLRGTWNHFVVSRIGTTVTIYLNAVQGSSATCTQDFNNTTYNPTIGDYTQGGFNIFTGNISNIKIYKGKGLTAAEVAQNYNALKSRFPIPTIVTDGLVLNLDAGNTLSYPGSGTTWANLSGNGNNGTLTNGPTFSSLNGGAIVFDGVNDFIDFTSDTNLLPTTGLSVSAWFKTSVADMWLVGKTSISTSNGYLLAGTGVGGVSFQVNGIGATSTESITNNSWIYVVGTWTPSTSILLYRNGSLIVTNTTSIPASIIEPSYTVEVGRRPNGPDYWNGSIAQVSIYNRALSADEVAQNFNALRGRFGI